MTGYLDKAVETQYMNVTMEALRVNTKIPKNSRFLSLFWREWYGELWVQITNEWERRSKNANTSCATWCIIIYYTIIVGCVTFFFGPINFLSRILTLFFPVWIVLYLYFGYGVNIWNTTKIDLFQVVMISIYVALCSIVWILFYFNLKEHYIMHHLFPAVRYLRCNGGLIQKMQMVC